MRTSLHKKRGRHGLACRIRATALWGSLWSVSSPRRSYNVAVPLLQIHWVDTAVLPLRAREATTGWVNGSPGKTDPLGGVGPGMTDPRIEGENNGCGTVVLFRAVSR